MPTPKTSQQASISRLFTEQDVNDFARLSGDFNPIHIDPEFAKTTVFGQRIVHGVLVSSLFSNLLAEKVPGKGSIYLGQTIKFKKPVFFDQTVTAKVEVINVREDKPVVTLSTICTNDQGEELITGEAVLMFNPDID
ncbi:MAG: acyl dehydratase [Oleiphilaceae bacterium]|jgi:acyl dehydratase